MTYIFSEHRFEHRLCSKKLKKREGVCVLWELCGEFDPERRRSGVIYMGWDEVRRGELSNRIYILYFIFFIISKIK